MTMSSSRQRLPLPLWTLLSANAVSNVGDVLMLVAIPWFVLQTTGSASKTGLVAAASAIPPVIAGVFGGTIVDRLGFKRMSILSDLASGAAVAMIPLLYSTVGLRFGVLILLVFLAALFYSPGNTARQSLLPDLAQLAGIPTERANAAYNGIQRSSMLLGPPLAGVLIALFSAGNVLWINAASFLVSAVALASVLPALTKEPAATGQGESYLGQVGEAFRFVLQDPLVLTMLVVLAVVNFVTAPLFDVILPVYARQVFDSAVALGIMMAGFGAGAVIGIVIYGAIGHRLSRRATFVSAFLLSTIPAWVLTMTPNLVLTTASLVVVGLASGPLNPLLMTIFQERTPPEMRGRLFGMIGAVAWVAMPLGMLISGVLIQHAGLRTMLVIIATAISLITIAILANPTLHELDRRNVAVPEAEQYLPLETSGNAES